MSKYSPGKYAKFISDRSGVAFPYTRRIKEWTGALVDISEYEPKHPQLIIHPPPIEGIALFNPRPDRKQAMVVTVGESFFSDDGPKSVPLQGITQLGVVKVTTS